MPDPEITPEAVPSCGQESYHALTGALFGAFAQRHRRQGAGWFVALPFTFACAWTVPEIIRGTAMTGLPILSLGYQMAGTAFFGYAPIVRLYGVGSLDPFQKLIVLRLFWPLFPGIPRFQYTYGCPNTKDARAAARH